MFKNEPALVVGGLAALVIAIAGHFNIVIDQAGLKEVLTPVVTAVITRQLVKPKTK